LAKFSQNSPSSRLLVLELWGLGDLALALPFLRAASGHFEVTLLAKPHAAPLLARFAPGVRHIVLTAPWTTFSGKYRLHRWPWRELRATVRELRATHFDLGISARRDPRDHTLLALSGARQRFGFPRLGSGLLLTGPLARPARPHRTEYWRTLADKLGFALPSAATRPPGGRRIVIHTGAGRPTRLWPRKRFAEIAVRLRTAGWDVQLLDDSLADLDRLLDLLADTGYFIGNDSGPGHLAALSGVPTFTIFGPQLPELFAPTHPQAAWIEGAPCPYKPCFDRCRFDVPHCLYHITVEAVWSRLQTWLAKP
jgi:ADP-heptose:LPS heptosyltransferase